MGTGSYTIILSNKAESICLYRVSRLTKLAEIKAQIGY
jgi:hypothetical protein